MSEAGTRTMHPRGTSLTSGQPSRSYPLRGSNGRSPSRFIAVGIDFGTTYSGVSWAHSDDPHNVHDITEWPAQFQGVQGEVQVPTQMEILSGKLTGKWGHELTNKMDRIKWFKLLLLEENDPALRMELRDSKQLKDARAKLDGSDVRTPAELVGKYLGKIWEHTLSQLKTLFTVDDLPLRVAITIPAIWPQYVEELMREAANIAGITSDRDMGILLEFVHEPEAAGLWTLYERQMFPDIQPGETYIVCDAGGGTVDAISYTVESKEPFVIKDCVVGDGNLSGAFLIDEAFETLLKGKKSLNIKSLSQSEYNNLVIRDWENGAKRSFINHPDQSEFTMSIPCRDISMRNLLRATVTSTSFALSRAEVKGFFDKSLTGIRSLVNQQYQHILSETKIPPKNILLVGGMGNSKYIYDVLNTLFKGIVLKPLSPWSAVARGAVIRLLQDSRPNLVPSPAIAPTPSWPSVRSRKSRYSYGIEVDLDKGELIDFDPRLDKVKYDPEGAKVVPRMRWYLKRGEEVTNKSPVIMEYFQHFQHKAPAQCVFEIMYSSSNTPPVRPEATALHRCRVTCEWDRPFEQWVVVGDPRRGWRRHDSLVLTLTFDPTPKWKVCVGSNEREHDAKVEYMN